MQPTRGRGMTLAGGLHIDPLALRATIGGRRLSLSARQVALLHVLALHRGQVLARQALHRLLGEPPPAPGQRGLDARIHRLRRVLAAHAGPWQLTCVTGLGYRFDDGSS